MKRLRRYILAGLVVVLPTAFTAYVLWFLFTRLDGILGSYLREKTGLSFPGIGVAAIILIIIAAGMMASNLIGKRFILFIQRGLESIPLFNRVYVAVRQISETLLSERSDVFRQVALVEYPRRGTYSICFITSVNSGEIAEKLSRKTVVLTFDDGYRLVFEVALPVLSELGFPGTMFINDEKQEVVTWAFRAVK